MKSVSVIIPNYNNAQYLESAINSILNQTFTNYEIIIVDDGSIDGSREVVGQFGDKVRYIWQENKGLGGARNTGILASNAEYVALLDADDEWEPVFLERMMSLIQKRPDAAVYYCGARGMNETGRYLPQIFGRGPSSNDIYESLLRANFIIPSTIVFRRSVVLEAGLFEERNRELHGCEDWDLWLRLSPLHKFVGIPEPLVRYRLHNNTFSTNYEHMQKAVRGVIERNFGADDSNYGGWSAEKGRAFGGAYRYRAITFIQRQNNWDAAGDSLQKALRIDPSLAMDIDFFYELALGSQQAGHRGISALQDFDTTAANLQRLVQESVDSLSEPTIRKIVWGTTYYALGLASYNLGTRSLFRRYFVKALLYRPELIFDAGFVARYFKSFVNRNALEKFRKLVGRTS